MGFFVEKGEQGMAKLCTLLSGKEIEEAFWEGESGKRESKQKPLLDLVELEGTMPQKPLRWLKPQWQSSLGLDGIG